MLNEPFKIMKNDFRLHADKDIESNIGKEL